METFSFFCLLVIILFAGNRLEIASTTLLNIGDGHEYTHYTVYHFTRNVVKTHLSEGKIVCPKILHYVIWLLISIMFSVHERRRSNNVKFVGLFLKKEKKEFHTNSELLGVDRQRLIIH